MRSIFEAIETQRYKRNRFDLSHDRKLSCKMGRCVPTMLLETLPGDVFEINSSHLLRFSPLINPVMHEINIDFHYFYVALRTIFPKFPDFIRGGDTGLDTTLAPTIDVNLNALPVGSTGDYLGLPAETVATRTVTISALPLSALMYIWNEYYRDQVLQTELDFELEPGDNSSNTDLTTQLAADPPIRSWNKDYFTSAAIAPQKGPEATIPLGNTAPLIYDFDFPATATTLEQIGGVPGVNEPLEYAFASGTTGLLQNDANTKQFNVDVSGHTFADLSQATASSVTDLRRAIKLQEWLELNARGGSRYPEYIKNMFDVDIGDATINRPEYLGGTRSPVIISEVLQTAETNTTPQGNMSGHAVSIGQTNKIAYYCKEHGFIIGLMSVMPKTAYYGGIPKIWTKFDKFDYYTEKFAGIGEQAILNQELFVSDDQAVDENVFGYTIRYGEYKYIPSTVHGEFAKSKDTFHLGRTFSATPNLNESFIWCIPDNRIFIVQVPDAEDLDCHVYNRVMASRKMGYFGTPRPL